MCLPDPHESVSLLVLCRKSMIEDLLAVTKKRIYCVEGFQSFYIQAISVRQNVNCGAVAGAAWLAGLHGVLVGALH